MRNQSVAGAGGRGLCAPVGGAAYPGPVTAEGTSASPSSQAAGLPGSSSWRVALWSPWASDPRPELWLPLTWSSWLLKTSVLLTLGLVQQPRGVERGVPEPPSPLGTGPYWALRGHTPHPRPTGREAEATPASCPLPPSVRSVFSKQDPLLPAPHLF